MGKLENFTNLNWGRMISLIDHDSSEVAVRSLLARKKKQAIAWFQASYGTAPFFGGRLTDWPQKIWREWCNFPNLSQFYPVWSSQRLLRSRSCFGDVIDLQKSQKWSIIVYKGNKHRRTAHYFIVSKISKDYLTSRFWVEKTHHKKLQPKRQRRSWKHGEDGLEALESLGMGSATPEPQKVHPVERDGDVIKSHSKAIETMTICAHGNPSNHDQLSKIHHSEWSFSKGNQFIPAIGGPS